MNFNIKKEKRYQYFAPDNASTIPFSIALNNHITYLNKKFEDLVLLCIGTDKITGDCLGPLVGSKLKQRKFPYPLSIPMLVPLPLMPLLEPRIILVLFPCPASPFPQGKELHGLCAL